MIAPESLTNRSLRALKWNYLGTAGRIVAQFASQIVLARLLGPEPMGMFGYAFLVVSFCTLLIEMGLGSALVQAPSADSHEISTVSGRLLLVAAIVSLGIFIAAPSIATHVFSAPSAASMIAVMAPSMLISAAEIPVAAVLRRDINFRVIQMASLGSYVFGYLIIGIGAASFGLGAWSLVLAWYAQISSSCVALYLLAPRSVMPGNPFKALSLSGFGRIVMFTNLMNWVMDNGTHALIGRLYGASALGQFTMANNLVRTPANHLVTNVQAVLFPIASRAQDNDAGLRRAYLTVLSGIGLIAFPTFMFVACTAQEFVLTLLGPKWEQAASVLAPLAAAMIPHAAMAICGPILNGRGEPQVELRMQAINLALLVPALFVASRWSLPVVAWALAGVFLARCLWMTMALVGRLKIPMRELGAALAGPLLLSALVALTVVACRLILELAAGPQPAALALVAYAVVCFALLVSVTWFVPPLILGPQLLNLAGQMLNERPRAASLPGLRRIALLAAKRS